MAFNKIARKSSKFRVVFTVPDFCWPPSPAPPSVPPIPFPLFADLGGAKTVAKDVRLNRKPAFVFKASKTDKTYGDEISLPGRKGVKSRTATKPAWPMRHSSSVKIRKSIQLHHVEGKEPGPMLEILASIHLSFKKQSNWKSIYSLLHPYVKPGYQSFRRNPNLNASYENFRKEHWKKRAESYLKSQEKCAEEECG